VFAASIIVTTLVGLFFLFSGILKAREGQAVVSASVEAYRLGGQRFSAAVGWALPRAEIATGLALLCFWEPLVGSIAAVVLLLTFVAAMVTVLRRGMTTDCGCHGSLASSEVRPALVLRNGVLIALIVGAILARPPITFGSPSGAFSVAVTAVIIAVLIAATIQRLTQRRRAVLTGSEMR
jgi:hypothetical protein